MKLMGIVVTGGILGGIVVTSLRNQLKTATEERDGYKGTLRTYDAVTKEISGLMKKYICNDLDSLRMELPPDEKDLVVRYQKLQDMVEKM